MTMLAGGATTLGAIGTGYALKNLSSESNSQGSGGGGNNGNILKKP